MHNEPKSEDAVLACLARYFPATCPALLLGRGDDCAVLRPGGPLCVSTDLFLEDTHFRRSYFTPEEIGHKALAVNISDLAACGAEPLAFTLGIGLPADMHMPWLERMFQGMAASAAHFHMGLAGGDLSRADKLHLSLTVWGEALPSGANGTGGISWLSRQGAKPGNTLFLAGEAGLARVGLHMLESAGRKALVRWPAACAAHLRPTPKIAEGRTLARFAGCGVALMDISDGLARDLPRLLQGFGADIALPESLLHEEITRYARLHDTDPAWEAFLGGEDYALLGSAPPERFRELQAALPQLREIGRVTEKTLCLNGKKVTESGFDHFSDSDNDSVCRFRRASPSVSVAGTKISAAENRFPPSDNKPRRSRRNSD